MTIYRLPCGRLVAVSFATGRRPPLMTHVRLGDGRVLAAVRSGAGS